MKPVKNTTQSMLQIGKTYKVLNDGDEFDDDLTEITIATFVSCPTYNCSFRNDYNKCEQTQLLDESGSLWCGIPKDFKEIEE